MVLIVGLVSVLFVSVCVPVSVTMPDVEGTCDVKASVPVVVGTVRVAPLFVMVAISGLVNVLLVNVSVPVFVAQELKSAGTSWSVVANVPPLAGNVNVLPLLVFSALSERMHVPLNGTESKYSILNDIFNNK